MRRLALYGRPGAGKSTAAKLLTDQLATRNVPVVRVRLAAPLYDLQAIIYSIAGRPLLDPARQDGLLLNALGSHLRRINAEALTGIFAQRVAQATREVPDAVLVCDDMRAPDVAALREMEFTLVQVRAPHHVLRVRRRQRGDLTLGADTHPTEAEVNCLPDHIVDNDAGLGHLGKQVDALIQELVS